VKFIQHNLFALFNFLLFAVLLWALLKKPLSVFLATRRERFRLNMENAAKRRRLADKRLEKCEARLMRLGDEVAEVLREMEAQGGKEKEALVGAARGRAQRMCLDAQRKTVHEIEKLKHDLHRHVVASSLGEAETILRERLKGDEAIGLVRSSVETISREELLK